MQLPNYEKAIIDSAKLQDYILSPTHPLGRFKARVFQQIGYTSENWKQLAEDIKYQHLSIDAEKGEETEYGEKYTIAGWIRGPNGKSMLLTSVWIILRGENVPRFITIYPEVHHEI